jgi:ABC-type multidrug transport system ATPase subunit
VNRDIRSSFRNMIQFRPTSARAFARRVLDDISLDIGLGERVALIGSNGAGKTTLIRCLLGEYTFDGEVTPSTVATRAGSARRCWARSVSCRNCRRR